ncbi:MAG TPA: hypothetical protein VFZ44_14805 [Pyrinomonadaceae bacterium]
MRSRRFIVGFVVGSALPAAANLYSYLRMGTTGRADCNDCSVSFGFPFPLWVKGGFVGVSYVLWGGLLADALIAVGAGVALGLLLLMTSKARYS